MEKSCPFVIAVASEKGGVGKTTIATNLAVFLKGLREDLPVSIASFDNHFSVDNMFAIGGHRGRSVAALFEGVPAGELLQMGEYGVEFMASDRSLTPPSDDPSRLRQSLNRSGLGGILVLDTRPILDYFTCSALLAADLVLVPIKDRASLINIASIRQAMGQIGADPSRLWLVPSLIDRRLRLRGNLTIDQFLRASAHERDYQVVDTYIAKSPKVEGLATNLTSRVYPVLTHARFTKVYRQFKELATFVLDVYDRTKGPLSRIEVDAGSGLKRLAPGCPVCQGEVAGEESLFYQVLRTRTRGFVHPHCLRSLCEGAGLEEVLAGGDLLAVEMGAHDAVGPDGFVMHLFRADGEKIADECVLFEIGSPWQVFLSQAAGRSTAELFLDVLLLGLVPEDSAHFGTVEGYREFSRLRRRILRQVLAPDA